MERLGGFTAIIIGLALVGSTVTVGASEMARTTPPPCPTTTHVDGLGPACTQDDGLLAVFDEEGTKLGTTHGPDPATPESEGESGGFLDYAPDAPVCAEDDDPHFQALFVHAQDTMGMNSEVRSEVLEETYRANARLKAASSPTSLEFRFSCSNGQIDIPVVQLPWPDGEVHFYNLVDHLESIGFDEENVKYWITYSGRGSMGFGGFGNLRADDDQQLLNDNNDNESMYAVTFEPFRSNHDDRFAHTLLHEASHTMGAVQSSAPNFYDNRGGWHCDDEDDVMCYGSETRSVCSGSERYDCNKDDYFNVDPAPGSYLAENWNIAHPYNRFLQGCMETRGVMETTDAAPAEIDAPQTGAPVLSQDTIEIPSDCRSRSYALWGALDDAGVGFFFPGQFTALEICWYDEPPQDGLQLGTIFVPGVDPQPSSGAQPIRCDQAQRDAPSAFVLTTTGTVPEDATSAAIQVTAGASVASGFEYTLKAT